jgi:GxxExxY protein
MRIALERRGIPYRAEWEIPLHFAGTNVGSYRLDLVADEQILLELKAVRRFEDIHFARVRAYLKASGLQIGLLINFNAKVIAVRRVVHDLME